MRLALIREASLTLADRLRRNEAEKRRIQDKREAIRREQRRERDRRKLEAEKQKDRIERARQHDEKMDVLKQRVRRQGQ